MTKAPTIHVTFHSIIGTRKDCMDNLSSEQLLEALAVKHSKDVFVPECKTGPTHYSHVQRLDAWVMRKSWAHPCAIGYEIKVSRSDFLADNKWPYYLDYCNEFSFVVAPGVCEPSEMMEGVGLLVASKNGSRLYTKRKAAFRDIEIPGDIFRYILMARAGIDEFATETTAEYWRRWLTEKEEDQHLGHRVSKRIQELVSTRITTVETKNRQLKNTNDALQATQAIFDELGIIETWRYGLKEKIQGAIAKAGGGQLVEEINRAVSSLEKLKESLAPAPE